MCLGVPGKILTIDGFSATVDFWGTQKTVLLHLVDTPVEVGDWVLDHVGYAVRKVEPEDLEPMLAMYAELRAAQP